MSEIEPKPEKKVRVKKELTPEELNLIEENKLKNQREKEEKQKAFKQKQEEEKKKTEEKKEKKVEKPIEANKIEEEKKVLTEDIVNPWDVQAQDEKGVDYDKLIKIFGSESISTTLLERIEKLTSKIFLTNFQTQNHTDF